MKNITITFSKFYSNLLLKYISTWDITEGSKIRRIKTEFDKSFFIDNLSELIINFR